MSKKKQPSYYIRTQAKVIDRFVKASDLRDEVKKSISPIKDGKVDLRQLKAIKKQIKSNVATIGRTKLKPLSLSTISRWKVGKFGEALYRPTAKELRENPTIRKYIEIGPGGKKQIQAEKIFKATKGTQTLKEPFEPGTKAAQKGFSKLAKSNPEYQKIIKEAEKNLKNVEKKDNPLYFKNKRTGRWNIDRGKYLKNYLSIKDSLEKNKDSLLQELDEGGYEVIEKGDGLDILYDNEILYSF